MLRDVDESSDAQELTLLPISTKGRHEDVTVTSDGFVGDFVDESAMASQSYSAEQRKNFGDVDGHYNTDSYRPVALPGTAGGSKGGLTDPHQHNRHVVLLLCLATSMLIVSDVATALLNRKLSMFGDGFFRVFLCAFGGFLLPTAHQPEFLWN